LLEANSQLFMHTRKENTARLDQYATKYSISMLLCEVDATETDNDSILDRKRQYRNDDQPDSNQRCWII